MEIFSTLRMLPNKNKKRRKNLNKMKISIMTFSILKMKTLIMRRLVRADPNHVSKNTDTSLLPMLEDLFTECLQSHYAEILSIIKIGLIVTPKKSLTYHVLMFNSLSNLVLKLFPLTIPIQTLRLDSN